MSSPAGGYGGSPASFAAKRVETSNERTNVIGSKTRGSVLTDGASLLLPVTVPVHSKCTLGTAALGKANLLLGVPEQQLHGAQVLRASIDQRGFGPPERVGSVACPVQSRWLTQESTILGILSHR